MNPNDASSRVPLPLQEAFARIKLQAGRADPLASLERVQVRSGALQEFRPLSETLEWELAQLHWAASGLLPFVEAGVPFLVNNSGILSEHAAALLFTNCLEVPAAGPIKVLELGAGTALFARYFLDSFRRLCEQEHQDFFERLVYYVTDRSMRTAEQWQEREQFADSAYADKVRIGTCDALHPSAFRAGTGEIVELARLRAVVCNYVLDVLPATVVRSSASGPEELLIRTHLTDDRRLLAQYTRRQPEEIAALAQSGDAAERSQLIPIVSLLEFETAFSACRQHQALAVEALTGAGEPVLLNHGALECLQACGALLDAGGIILVNDYGPVTAEQVSGHAVSQRFGPTTALGINFPFLERFLAARGYVVAAPETDERRGIHSRLIMRAELPQTIAAFRDRFGPAATDFFDVPYEEARRHVAAGRRNDALESYRLALARAPRAWHLSGEIAEFVGLQLRDYRAGRELIRAALEHNPWYSPWLWNVLGDILYLDQDVAGAHEAYLQAHKIHPQDVRTNLNLAYTQCEFGEYGAALHALAAAFAADVHGLYRARLLEKQQQILGAVSLRTLGEQERLVRRAQRMRAPGLPAVREPSST